MIRHGKGGANTQAGIVYEGKTSLAVFLNGLNKYKVTEWKEISGSGNSKAFKVKYANKEVANIFRQHAIYNFLKTFQVNWKQIISKKLLPDDSIFVLKDNVFYVIEIKFQNIAGSVDEKIQTCDFKKKQWTKILSHLNCKVEYWYLLSNWFKKPEYKDSLDYVISVNCRYFFEYIPLKELGLPMPKK